MAKLRIFEGTKGNYLFWCPACKKEHGVWTVDEGYPHPIWGFNGDMEKPTINPSLLCRTQYPDRTDICHSFIRNGKIEYLSDCTHNLAGKTIDMVDYNELKK